MASNDLLQDRLDRLLHARSFPKTICPSEVARSFTASELAELGVDHWRQLMGPVQALAWSQRADGHIEILQHGQVLPAESEQDQIRGPIRLRLPAVP